MNKERPLQPDRLSLMKDYILYNRKFTICGYMLLILLEKILVIYYRILLPVSIANTTCEKRARLFQRKGIKERSYGSNDETQRISATRASGVAQ